MGEQWGKKLYRLIAYVVTILKTITGQSKSRIHYRATHDGEL
jgi:hypothetical protein